MSVLIPIIIIVLVIIIAAIIIIFISLNANNTTPSTIPVNTPLPNNTPTPLTLTDPPINNNQITFQTVTPVNIKTYQQPNIIVPQYDLNSDSTQETDSDGSSVDPRIFLNSDSSEEYYPRYKKYSPPMRAEIPFTADSIGMRYPRNSNKSILDIVWYFQNLVCSYDDYTLYRNEEVIRSNRICHKLVVFKGFLLALSNYKLYYLTSDFNEDYWEFEEISQDILDNSDLLKDCLSERNNSILDISTTLDMRHLSIQTSDMLKIYDQDGNCCHKLKFPSTHRRIYGKNLKKYIDLDRIKCSIKVYPSATQYFNIIDACIDHDNEIIKITKDMYYSKNYTSIKLINWKPYVLKGDPKFPI